MTTFRDELITCVLCEERTLLPVMASTSSFGPPDLDLRPAATESAVLVDLLRRAGRFEEAVAEADAALGEAEGQAAAVLQLSRSLALSRDTECHLVEDDLAGEMDEFA